MLVCGQKNSFFREVQRENLGKKPARCFISSRDWSLLRFERYLSHLIGRETINIPEIFSGVHGFPGKTVNFIKVKARHFQTFSKSHSVICFNIAQIKQTFCIFRTCKRYACCLFWDSKKYTHANIKQPAWLANIGVAEKRSWGKLVTSEKSLWPRVKNMASRTCREHHTGWFFLKPIALFWEFNAMKLPTLMDEPNFCRA